MRIALLIPDLSGGGAETLVRHLAEGYRSHGLDVRVLFSRDDDERVEGKQRLRRLVGPISVPGALWHELRTFRADIVHAHTPWTGMQAVLERSARNGPRIVYTIHTRPKDKPPILRLAEYVAIRLADAAVCVSGAWSEEIPGRRVLTIDNGTPTQEATAERGEAPFLWIGRFIGRKEPEMFVQALAESQDLRGMMVGKGPLQAQLEHLAAHVGNVEIRSWVTDPTALMAEASAVVFTSSFEGLPVTALEAMALGTPVVAPDLPEFRFILPEAYPWMYRPGDVSHLQETLRDVLSDPDEALRVGQELRRHHAEGFSIETTVSNYIDLFRSLLPSA